MVEWAIPIAAFSLIPKCPACIGAYVLLFTGIGLSFRAATTLRWTLLALSISALASLLLRAMGRVAPGHFRKPLARNAMSRSE